MTYATQVNDKKGAGDKAVKGKERYLRQGVIKKEEDDKPESKSTSKDKQKEKEEEEPKLVGDKKEKDDKKEEKKDAKNLKEKEKKDDKKTTKDEKENDEKKEKKDDGQLSEADVKFLKSIKHLGYKSKVEEKDIVSLEDYERMRPRAIEMRRKFKAVRRVEIGRYVSGCFQNGALVWIQIQEMLRIEKGGSEQLQEELMAYTPLVPTPRRLVLTLMFEVDNPTKREELLTSLGHVENTVQLSMEGGADVIKARPIEDEGIQRTSEEGKTSAVHFLEFPMTPEQVGTFVSTTVPIHLSIEHPKYAHSTRLSSELVSQLREELAGH